MNDTILAGLASEMGVLVVTSGTVLPRADPLCTILVPNLLRQGLVERKDANLGARVVARSGERDKAGDTCNRDDMTVVVPDHGRQKLLDGPVVCYEIDLERPSNELFWLVDDRTAAAYSGIVHQYGRIAVFLSDFVGGDLESLSGRDVCLVEKGTTCYCLIQENCYFSRSHDGCMGTFTTYAEAPLVPGHLE